MIFIENKFIINEIKMKKQEKFRGKYRIKSSRAQWHSYDDGIFFVTFCTKNRLHSLGEIVGGEMMLSKIGEYTDHEIRDVGVRRPYEVWPNRRIASSNVTSSSARRAGR